MAEKKEGPARLIIRKLLAPLIISTCTGAIFFSAGSAYQSFGLAAFESSRAVISNVLGVTLFLSFGVLLDRTVRHVILDGLIARTLDTPVPGLIKQFSSILIYLVIGATILSVVFKKDLTVLWAASGVAGIVLGLALQTLLQDIYSGLALNIDRPLKIGDSIQIDIGASFKGVVKEISWRTTHIVDKSNNIIVMPNNKVASATITNFSKTQSSSIEFKDVTLDANVPHERVLRILTASAIEASVLFASEETPNPFVLVWDIVPNGVVYRIHYFCDLWHKDQAQSLILQCALRHLRQGGLQPAAPKIEQLTLDQRDWCGKNSADPETAFVLSTCSLLNGLGKEELLLFASKSNIRVIVPDQEIVHGGETGNTAYVLIEGLAAAVRKKGRSPDVPIMLHPGDSFGFESALLGEVYPATIRSRTDIIVCEMDAEAFYTLFAHYPAAVRVLSRNLFEASSAVTRTSNTSSSCSSECIVADTERAINRNFASAIRCRGKVT
jgi:small-conductance mechanosensitive channel/CRP-like cAMP-binding protein